MTDGCTEAITGHPAIYRRPHTRGVCIGFSLGVRSHSRRGQNEEEKAAISGSTLNPLLRGQRQRSFACTGCLPCCRRSETAVMDEVIAHVCGQPLPQPQHSGKRRTHRPTRPNEPQVNSST